MNKHEIIEKTTHLAAKGTQFAASMFNILSNASTSTAKKLEELSENAKKDAVVQAELDATKAKADAEVKAAQAKVAEAKATEAKSAESADKKKP